MLAKLKFKTFLGNLFVNIRNLELTLGFEKKRKNQRKTKTYVALSKNIAVLPNFSCLSQIFSLLN